MCFLPCKALRKEGQTTKNLLTVVELVHIRRRYHGDAIVVHDAEVVHTQTVTNYNKNHDNRYQLIYLKSRK